MRLGDPAAEADAREVERLMGSNRQLALLPQLALIYARFGHSVNVARLVAEVEARGRDTDIGVGTYLTLSLSTGDRAKVREWLDIAIGKIERQEPDAGYYEIVNVRLNAFGHPMLEEPEFRELRAKLGPL